jgi:DNA mismatch repair ATPase MutL
MLEYRTKEINILPDRSLMPKIGQTGYSVSQAIAELVDNSIDARQEGKSLTVEVLLDPQKGVIEISDNGIGMNGMGTRKTARRR